MAALRAGSIGAGLVDGATGTDGIEGVGATGMTGAGTDAVIGVGAMGAGTTTASGRGRAGTATLARSISFLLSKYHMGHYMRKKPPLCEGDFSGEDEVRV